MFGYMRDALFTALRYVLPFLVIAVSVRYLWVAS
jgi:hypothetical protein